MMISVIVLMCAGCSPYVYKEEIKDFAATVALLDEAIGKARDAHHLDATRRTAVDYHRRIAEGRAQFDASRECGIGGGGPLSPQSGTGCRIVDTKAPGGPKVIVDDNLKQAFTDAEAVSKALGKYSKSLKQISNADDRAELDAANKGLCSAVDGIAGVVAPVIGPIFGVSCGLIGAASAAVLDQARYQALKQGVAEADAKVIARLADYLGRTFVVLGEGRLRDQRALLRADLKDIKVAASAGLTATPTYEARMTRLFGTVDVINETIHAIEPSEMVADTGKDKVAPADMSRYPTPSTREKSALALWTAHRALRLAIDRNDGQLSEVTKAIADFGDRVQELRKALADKDD